MKKGYLTGLALGITAMLSVSSAQAGTIWGNNAGSYGISKFDSTTGAQDFNFYPGGNGRGVVQVGNTLYTTRAGSGNVFKSDATTGASLGVAFSVAGSSGLQAIAYDGTDFWIGDYSGTNEAYKYSSTGTLLNTVSLANAAGYYDGLEYFNDKLIANRFDGGYGGTQHYDIYSATDGALLTADFINTSGHGNGTGIAFDGTNFFVSDIFNNQLSIWDGMDGHFIDYLVLEGSNGAIEDLSVDYAKRDDTSGTPIPEPGTMLLMGTGLAGLMVARRKKKA